MVVCSHCGRESRAADRFCQYCGQQLDPSNGHLVAAFAPRYAGTSGGSSEWQGPLADAPATSSAAVSSADQHSGQGVSQMPAQLSSHARLVVRQVPETSDDERGSAMDAAGREYQLAGDDVAIGRAPSCDVVLEGDQLASRRHALLRRKGEFYTIVDLGSSNGTYVNDLEIREATPLKDGDVITIGSHEIAFSTTPASPHASIPGAAFAAAPAGPLGETDPNASAVNPPIFSASAPSDAIDEQLVADGADAGALAAPVENAGAQPLPSDVVLPLDLLDAADASATSDAGAASAVAGSQSSTEYAPAERAGPSDTGGSEAGASGAASGFAVATAATSGATDLEGLRVQLAEIGAALARKADEEARTADRLRAILAEARDRLTLLSEQSAQQPEQAPAEDVPVPAAHVSELVSIARQAAENPRHLDYLTSLAAHAGEIAVVLESLDAHQTSAQSPGGNAQVLDVLNELRVRLDDALNQH